MSQPEDTPAQWFLYMIRCGDNSLYTGVTSDLARRFAEHSAQGPKTAKYLRGRGPLSLAFQVPVGNRSQALQCEYQVKQLSRQDKELLVSGQLSFDQVMVSDSNNPE